MLNKQQNLTISEKLQGTLDLDQPLQWLLTTIHLAMNLGPNKERKKLINLMKKIMVHQAQDVEYSLIIHLNQKVQKITKKGVNNNVSLMHADESQDLQMDDRNQSLQKSVGKCKTNKTNDNNQVAMSDPSVVDNRAYEGDGFDVELHPNENESDFDSESEYEEEDNEQEPPPKVGTGSSPEGRFNEKEHERPVCQSAANTSKSAEEEFDELFSDDRVKRLFDKMLD